MTGRAKVSTGLARLMFRHQTLIKGRVESLSSSDDASSEIHP
jgi:hypothetical protein